MHKTEQRTTEYDEAGIKIIIQYKIVNEIISKERWKQPEDPHGYLCDVFTVRLSQSSNLHFPVVASPFERLQLHVSLHSVKNVPSPSLSNSERNKQRTKVTLKEKSKSMNKTLMANMTCRKEKKIEKKKNSSKSTHTTKQKKAEANKI
jgi:hypothetical protein